MRACCSQIARELEIDPDVRVVEVEDLATAERLRFLGSPTIRVDGHDVVPRADERGTYALACRVYPTDRGMRGLPDPAWLREALTTSR